MPLTALDPRTALIVVDVQKGIVEAVAHPAIDQVVTRSRALLDAFRERGLPVVLVNVAGSAPGRTERAPRQRAPLTAEWTDFVAELNPQASDIIITKRSWGAFTHTDLEAQLNALKVTQVVITGVATGTGVEASARQAYELGFHVTLAIDAMVDTRPEAHDYSINHVFPKLGETGTTQAIIDLLDTRSVSQ